MLTPSFISQTPRIFFNLIDSPMTDDWGEKDFCLDMDDYATFPQIHDNKLLEASTDPSLPCFTASYGIDDLCAKLADEEEDDDEDGYEDEMERNEELEEAAEAAMMEWNKPQTFLVELLSAKVAEVRRNPSIAEDCISRELTSPDPWSWTRDDVSAWCDWALERFRVSETQRDNLLQNLHLSGNELCQFSVSDFQQHFGTSGKYLYAELELWKNVHIIASTESEQKLYSAKVDRDSTDEASQLVSCRIPLNHTISDKITSSSVTSHCLPVMSTENTSISVTSTSLSSFTSELPLTSHASTSQSSASLGNLSASFDHRIPIFVTDSVPDTPPCGSDASFRGRLLEDAGPGAAAAAEAEGLWGCFNITGLLSDADSGNSLDSDCTLSCDATQKTNHGESPDLWQPYAKQGNHLWQFLHELLGRPSIYRDCIRWIDRQQGIFKIEDSVHVAKLWGERKNRPAMNYDKLSRSIRQYYKKGIIRKTSQSKRLVYQFCPRYA